jgi:hypothetical protein
MDPCACGVHVKWTGPTDVTLGLLFNDDARPNTCFAQCAARQLDDLPLNNVLTLYFKGSHTALRYVERLSAPADACDVLVLRLDIPEPESSLAYDAPYVLLLRPYERGVKPVVRWGVGPPALVSCIRDADLLVTDLFPLSLGRGEALQAMRRALLLASVDLFLFDEHTLTLEDAAAHLDASWLDCERVNARPLP